MKVQVVEHAFAPVYDEKSRVLILGTMPSPQSVKHGFYYSHPQNRFWPLLATLFQEEVPCTCEEKRNLALRHGIALWDVLARCEIAGASDASIRKPVPNDFSCVLRETSIERIFTTGKTAYRLFQALVAPVIGRDAIYLPSTSPANQALFPWTKLLEAWQILLQ
ncbi:MAG: DNA-deoxyinosine glycosylase [Victivallales bacterium]|nr:DNA-deoxyinosine glycosylase [Victivallales bacterium]